VLARLTAADLLPKAAVPVIERLPGGVSADVFSISWRETHLVVKRARPQLAVESEWLVSPARVVVEAAAMEAARQIRPENVPIVVDLDPDDHCLVMPRADPSMTNWKVALLSGSIDAHVAEALGRALGDWHAISARDPTVLERFADRRYFIDLRIEPFFRTAADVNPDLADRISSIVERILSRQDCLVHGDFSPKNVLIDLPRFWVVDWEIAHVGDPTFDLAFLFAHLVCKSIHRPSDSSAYRLCAQRFRSAYDAKSSLEIDEHALVEQVACLVLARVDGKAPAEYLDERERKVARHVARSTLIDEPVDVWALWEAL
jgi:aminoglycoside phosphotransferase (APT) family kinase protein